MVARRGVGDLEERRSCRLSAVRRRALACRSVGHARTRESRRGSVRGAHVAGRAGYEEEPRGGARADIAQGGESASQRRRSSNALSRRVHPERATCRRPSTRPISDARSHQRRPLHIAHRRQPRTPPSTPKGLEQTRLHARPPGATRDGQHPRSEGCLGINLFSSWTLAARNEGHRRG